MDHRDCSVLGTTSLLCWKRGKSNRFLGFNDYVALFWGNLRTGLLGTYLEILA